MTVEQQTLRVGGFGVPMPTAKAWISDYTNESASSASSRPSPYAYPAYDQYNQADNDPLVLTDADLLAPLLLNVQVKLRPFYRLCAQKELLERALKHSHLKTPLADLSDAEIRDAIGPLYQLLDGPESPWKVNGGTTLSKILHRKRPETIALHDRNVSRCYVGPRAPIPRTKVRTWQEYMVLLSQAMARDLRDQRDQFAGLQAASKATPPLSDLRLLDIVAWFRGQETHTESAT